jgi:DNA polymerase III epsilon subunit-like protein
VLGSQLIGYLQVAAVEFLNFCLEASARNGGALPVLVAHNASFDKRMLLHMCWQAGLDVPSEWRTLCTLQVVQQLKKGKPLEVLKNLPDMKLGSLAAAFGCGLLIRLRAPMRWLNCSYVDNLRKP